MIRRALRLAVALGVLALVSLAVVVAAYRPRSWRAVDVHPPPVAADPARLRATIESFPPFRSREHASTLAAMEALVVARLHELGWEIEGQQVNRAPSVFARHPGGNDPPTHNLIARKQLARERPFAVIAAHLDSVSAAPGADDDGSGVAVMLELARLLSPGAASRTELVFFNEEENGLFGSSTFVASLSAAERSQLTAAYVMDMVGAYDDRAHSQTYPPPLAWLAPDRGDFLSAIALTDADAAVQALHRAHDEVAAHLPVEVFEPPRTLAMGIPDIWRSDHAPFWAAKLPAVFLTDTGEFRDDRYHNARDTAAALDYARLAEVVDVLAAMQEASSQRP